jgi:hypothetical protein
VITKKGSSTPFAPSLSVFPDLASSHPLHQAWDRPSHVRAPIWPGFGERGIPSLDLLDDRMCLVKHALIGRVIEYPSPHDLSELLPVQIEIQPAA